MEVLSDNVVVQQITERKWVREPQNGPLEVLKAEGTASANVWSRGVLGMS